MIRIMHTTLKLIYILSILHEIILYRHDTMVGNLKINVKAIDQMKIYIL